ncbi:MAG: M6 family metalloprotease domain-containing protein [FCB group bacterium]|nr:M6 family metalloprotease domain-containing protein [FCB group bacterium]
MTSSVLAVAPSDKVIDQWKKDGSFQYKMDIWKQFLKKGGEAPVKYPVFSKTKINNSLALGIKAIDTVHVLVLLVDFSDNPWYGQKVAGTPADFDSILFSDRTVDSIYNPSGSMTDYYMENSYGRFYIKGDIYGWYRMPKTYAYYVDGDNNGLTKSQELANDVITAAAADTMVNFSKYDYNGDGKCDGVIIIHSGPGAETAGSGIWSHKWQLPTPRYIDGVAVSNYTMNPEEYFGQLSPIGVFCHEYGHFLGLPDLYDTNESSSGTSQGLGRWSLMASGNYNGNSRKPAHLDAWCKKEIGFLNPIVVDSNLYHAEIPQVENEPVVYQLQNQSSNGEYWLVENRQKVGFDVSLPGAGLLIYHIDESVIDNDNPNRYKVALEQADGNNALAFGGSRGDEGDPFPGFTNNHSFNDLTNPNSHTYAGNKTGIGVWNISNSDSLMFADFDISYSRPWVELSGNDSIFFDDSFSGNNDGFLDPGETIKFFFKIKNLMRTSYNVHASLATNNPDLHFSTNNIDVYGVVSGSEVNNALIPITFSIPDTLTPQIDSFFLTIVTDSVNGIAGGTNYTKTFGFEATLGKPNILLVDDDRGADYEKGYQQALHQKLLPAAVWNVDSLGAPTISELNKYSMVFWFTGDTTSSAVFTADDIALMKQYLDNNGNLFVSSISAARDFNNLDSAFMADYFKAALAGSAHWPIYEGVPGSPLGGDSAKYMTSTFNFYDPSVLTIVDGGQPAFTMQGTDICGVTYSGSYKTVLLTFSVELIDDSRFDTKATLISKVIDFFGGVATAVYDGHPFSQLPKNFDLQQNYPNPFNPTTTISYTLRAAKSSNREATKTFLAVYNIMGQKVKTLVDEIQAPGHYNVEWDSTNDHGKKVASGIYFYRLLRGNDSETKKMVLLK